MTELEDALAQLIARFRRDEVEPLARRLDVLEQRQSLEARLARLEVRAGENAEAKFEHGEPLVEREWRELCERIQAPLRLGVWAPQHSSWRGGR